MKMRRRAGQTSSIPNCAPPNLNPASLHLSIRCPESDDEDEAESRAKRARKVPFALLPEEDLAALRDEVERVITHRLVDVEWLRLFACVSVCALLVRLPFNEDESRGGSDGVQLPVLPGSRLHVSVTQNPLLGRDPPNACEPRRPWGAVSSKWLAMAPRCCMQGPAQCACEPRRPLGQPRVLCQVGPQLLPALHLGAQGHVCHGARGMSGLGMGLPVDAVLCAVPARVALQLAGG